MDIGELVELASLCWSGPVSAAIEVSYCFLNLVLGGLNLEEQIVFLFQYCGEICDAVRGGGFGCQV